MTGWVGTGGTAKGLASEYTLSFIAEDLKTESDQKMVLAGILQRDR